jgi:molybdate transport system ATP-binding protein/molybdate/tungstate transport system ATP-binding protein
MENIFKGRCSYQDGISSIMVSGHTIYSATCTGEREVYATIRPEDILLSQDPIVSSARNSFKGKITDIKNNGMVIKVTIDIGIPIVSVMTRRGWDELHMNEGEEVYLAFKASAVHVF